MAPVVLGRQAELDQLTAKLDAVVAGPCVVVVEGPAGIGKTTMWQAALGAARARSFTVLAARAAHTEATLPFAGLIDLFEAVPEAGLAALPAPQRRAMEVALLRRDPEETGVDQLAVSLGALQVLRTLAVDAPVVVGVDDLQWLDGATTRVLAFVLRRLGDERLGPGRLGARRARQPAAIGGRAGAPRTTTAGPAGGPSAAWGRGPASAGAETHRASARRCLLSEARLPSLAA